jgi:hypothetical protein
LYIKLTQYPYAYPNAFVFLDARPLSKGYLRSIGSRFLHCQPLLVRHFQNKIK